MQNKQTSMTQLEGECWRWKQSIQFGSPRFMQIIIL